MTDQVHILDDEPFDRGMVLGVIFAGVAAGTPAPKEIRFTDNCLTVGFDNCLTVGFDSAADLHAWEPTFGLSEGRGGHSEQPYPLDPPSYQEWWTTAWTWWHGWHLQLKAGDPITDENKRWWIESGNAAQRVEYVARQADGGEQA